jgi:hypothetical protein
MRLAGEVVRIPLAEHKGRYRFEMATPSNASFSRGPSGPSAGSDS